MQYEYDSLWKELLEWQRRRVTLLTTSITIVVAVLGIGQGFSERVPWWTITTLLLLMLSATCELTAYAGYANQKIGSFLEVFHDPKTELKWNLRSAKFAEQYRYMTIRARNRKRLPNLNKQLFQFYALLGFLTLALPPLTFRGQIRNPQSMEAVINSVSFVAVVCTALLYCVVLYRLYHSQSRRNAIRIRKVWFAILLAESSKTTQSVGRGAAGNAEPN